MQSKTTEVFLEPGEIQVFESVKSAALAFDKCKRTQLDAVMPAHIARRDAQFELGGKLHAVFQDACVEYVNELLRSVLRETGSRGYPKNTISAGFRTWHENLLRELHACVKIDVHGLGYGRLSEPDSPSVQALRHAFTHKVLGKWIPTSIELRFLAEFSSQLQERLGTDNLLWLAESTFRSPNTALLKRDAFVDWLAAPPEDLNALHTICQACENRVKECISALTRLENKITNAGTRVLFPMRDYVMATSVEQKEYLLVSMLCQMVVDITELYKPEATKHKKPYTRGPLSNDPWGSQFIFQILFQAEPYDWRTFADGVTALLEKPRAFNRWNCPSEHKGVKIVLRDFVELVAGPIAFPVERADLLTRLRAPAASREEIISLTSQYLGLVCWKKDLPSRLNNQMTTMLDNWIADLSAWYEGLQVKERRFRLRRADDVEFEKLMSDEAAASAKLSEEMARWKESWIIYQSQSDKEEPTPECDRNEPPETIQLTYVENLGSESWRTHEIKSARNDLATCLDQHLTTQAIETVVPVPSIARAIEHFIFEMTPDQRTLLPMERIAGEPWRKLKRGAQRIYLLEKDGEIFLHLMKRKDWAVAATQEARF